MKILVVTQYFWPESFLINDLCLKLKEQGNDVTVLTGKPNYPKGQLFPGYRKHGLEYDEYEGIKVIRMPLRPRKKGGLNLFFNYMSFVFSGVRYVPKVIEREKYDFVFIYAVSPITTAVPLLLYKNRVKAHVALWVQDLWPQSLKSTGYITNESLLSLVRLLVKWIYKKSDTILAQSHAFAADIAKYVPQEKIFYYPNAIEKRKTASLLPEQYHNLFSGKFSILFAGNVGRAQSIPTLIEAASKLKNSNCQFVIAGDGSMLAWAKSKVKELKLGNVIFLGWLEKSLMASVYNASDAMLVSLCDDESLANTLPGKFQVCLSMGKPILVSANGELSRIVTESKSGLVSPAEDAQALADSIRLMCNLPHKERRQFGSNALEYFENNYELNKQARQLIELMERRLG